MIIELEVTVPALFRLFESKEFSSSTVRPVPGGVTIQLGAMPERRGSDGSTLSFLTQPLLPVILNFGEGAVGSIAIGLFTNWLYDKLKGSDQNNEQQPTIRINRKEIHLTREGITKIISEEIELENERKQRSTRRKKKK